ncbi:MAG: YdbL family protein [Sneathiella sp.]
MNWDKWNKKTGRRTVVLGGLAIGAFLSLSVLSPLPVAADTLNDLRLSGALGEAFDGFARARKNSVADFVADVNKKRRAIYAKRAKSQGVPVGQVGRVYASQIREKAPAGTWFLSESGDWSQK